MRVSVKMWVFRLTWLFAWIGPASTIPARYNVLEHPAPQIPTQHHYYGLGKCTIVIVDVRDSLVWLNSAL